MFKKNLLKTLFTSIPFADKFLPRAFLINVLVLKIFEKNLEALDSYDSFFLINRPWAAWNGNKPDFQSSDEDEFSKSNQ
ncbi:hypothetical protein BpHYR1_003397 [Brachionus plicatilis]|uniref:Uncharacterized protein n=1 Tax=Brachionus plicatilis TaxID=10195 RepID=A0A3M7QHY1_BRAPC|nr:hypothetical protein BpHYR1_003397 [Brachionus plicatilis]